MSHVEGMEDDFVNEYGHASEFGVSHKTFVAKQYDSNEWKTVPMKYLGEDDESIIYKVSTFPTLHVFMGEKGSVLTAPAPDEGKVEETEQKKDVKVTGAAVFFRTFKENPFLWIFAVFAITIIVLLVFVYKSKNGSDEGDIFPTVSEDAPVEPKKEVKEERFSITEDELRKNKEEVRKELGL